MGIREFLLLAADGLAAKLAWQAFIDELRLLGFARALIPLSNIAILTRARAPSPTPFDTPRYSPSVAPAGLR